MLGDGKDDPAIYRNGTWWILRSQAGAVATNFKKYENEVVPHIRRVMQNDSARIGATNGSG